MQQNKSLVRKMAEIMTVVGRIEKKGTNDRQKYNYVREEDVLEALRTEMAQRHLMIFPSMIDQSVIESGKTSNGAQKFLTSVTMQYTIVDGETGEERTITQGGQGEDMSDKGIYKATTGANKYALLKLFMIPTGDDPELDPSMKGQQNQNQQGNQNNRNQQQQNNQNKRADGPPPVPESKQLFHDLFGSVDRYEAWMNHFGANDEQAAEWLRNRLTEKKEYGRKIVQAYRTQGGTKEDAAKATWKGLFSGMTFQQIYQSLNKKQKAAQ